MPQFNLSDYQTVEERIHLFWETHPNGRLINEIIFDDGERVVIKASVWTDATNENPTTVDFAEEILTQKGVNSTSRIENCATSATGRALSLLGGVFSPKGKRPSQQEMAKVQRRQEQPRPTAPQPVQTTAPVSNDRQALLDRLNALPADVRKDAKELFLFQFGKPAEVLAERLEEAAEWITRYEVDAPW